MHDAISISRKRCDTIPVLVVVEPKARQQTDRQTEPRQTARPTKGVLAAAK
jgi:hypothetical protein